MFGGAILSGLIGLAIFGYAPLGRGLRAMAANPRGAVLCGYSADSMNAMAWFLGGALAGLAGIFAAPSKGISPELAISMITAGFVAAVIGGFDSLRGALLGGLILGVAETLAAGYVSSAMKNAVSFLLLFVVLLWRPAGPVPGGEDPRCLDEQVRAVIAGCVCPPSALRCSRVGIVARVSAVSAPIGNTCSRSRSARPSSAARLAMLVGYARCITIATGAMMAIGAYGAAVPVVHAKVPFLAALVFATVLGAIAGIILAVPGVRFRSHNLAMVTLVFQAVVIIVLRESKALTGGAEGLNVPPPVIFGVSFSGDADFLLLCGVLAAIIILPMAILLEGPFGKNLRAVASNENAARAFGIDVRHHLIAAFALELGGDRVRRRDFGAAFPHHRSRQLRHSDVDFHARLSDHRRHGLDLGRAGGRRRAAYRSRAAAAAGRLHRADLLHAGGRDPYVLSRTEWRRRSGSGCGALAADTA